MTGLQWASIELSRIEVARVADVLLVLRAPYRCTRKAARAHGIPAGPFGQILHRPASLSLRERSLDAIAAAAGVSRAELLAGRALAAATQRAARACAPSVELAHAEVKRAAAVAGVAEAAHAGGGAP